MKTRTRLEEQDWILTWTFLQTFLVLDHSSYCTTSLWKTRVQSECKPGYDLPWQEHKPLRNGSKKNTLWQIGAYASLTCTEGFQGSLRSLGLYHVICYWKEQVSWALLTCQSLLGLAQLCCCSAADWDKKNEHLPIKKVKKNNTQH